MPIFSSVPAALFSTSASERSTSRPNTSRPSSLSRSIVTEYLLRNICTNVGEWFQGRLPGTP